MSRKPKEEVPRYRVLLQDGQTSVQVAAGTSNLNELVKKDLIIMVRHFKKLVRQAEKAKT